jgi:hypothetical protein
MRNSSLFSSHSSSNHRVFVDDDIRGPSAENSWKLFDYSAGKDAAEDSFTISRDPINVSLLGHRGPGKLSLLSPLLAFDTEDQRFKPEAFDLW